MACVNLHEAKARLAELLRRAEQGEEIILARRNRPIARIVPIHAPAHTRTLGSWAGEIAMADDFDDPLDDFDAYR